MKGRKLGKLFVSLFHTTPAERTQYSIADIRSRRGFPIVGVIGSSRILGDSNVEHAAARAGYLARGMLEDSGAIMMGGSEGVGNIAYEGLPFYDVDELPGETTSLGENWNPYGGVWLRCFDEKLLSDRTFILLPDDSYVRLQVDRALEEGKPDYVSPLFHLESDQVIPGDYPLHPSYEFAGADYGKRPAAMAELGDAFVMIAGSDNTRLEAEAVLRNFKPLFVVRGTGGVADEYVDHDSQNVHVLDSVEELPSRLEEVLA
jgi:hypothetical protein